MPCVLNTMHAQVITRATANTKTWVWSLFSTLSLSSPNSLLKICNISNFEKYAHTPHHPTFWTYPQHSLWPLSVNCHLESSALLLILSITIPFHSSLRKLTPKLPSLFVPLFLFNHLFPPLVIYTSLLTSARNIDSSTQWELKNAGMELNCGSMFLLIPISSD